MMKKESFFSLVLSLLVATGVSAEGLSYLKATVPRIDARSAYLKYKAGKIIIVDAMNPKTFAKYHILGVINLPIDSVANRERWGKAMLPFPKNQEIIVYCD